MISEHTYYIPAHKKVYGSRPELAAFLYATYLKYVPVDVDAPLHPTDGVSLFCDNEKEVIRIVFSKPNGEISVQDIVSPFHADFK